MGVTLTIGGQEVHPTSYSISEEATPILGGDTYGAVASFDLTVPVGELNPVVLYQASVVLVDDQYGSISGHVDKVTRSDDGATLSLGCLARTARLAAYNVTAPPHVGTLFTALQSYLILGDATLAWTMPNDMKTIPVAFIGWTGDLWLHLKELAVAFGLEIAFNKGYVEFRRPRGLVLSDDWVESRSVDIGDNSLADKTELYWYETSPVTNASVYPPNKDLEHAVTYSIPAGEETEIILQLETSLSSVVQPTFRETVTPTNFSQSNISLTKEDGSRVTFGDWMRGGGAARVEIMDDPTQLKLIVRGPTGPGTATYRLAVASTNTHREYSSIRIVGNGVAFTKNRVEVPTGVKPNYASSEMAPTQENIFVSNAGKAWDLCTSNARAYATAAVSASFSAPYIGNPEPLGVVPGGRFYDTQSRQWYRARTVTYDRGLIKVSADLDTTHADTADMYAGKTYAQVQAMNAGKTYTRVMLDGTTR